VDVDEVMDVHQDHITLSLEVKAIGWYPPMDIHISSQEVFAIPLHSHRLQNSTYLVLLLQDMLMTLLFDDLNKVGSTSLTPSHPPHKTG